MLGQPVHLGTAFPISSSVYRFHQCPANALTASIHSRHQVLQVANILNTPAVKVVGQSHSTIPLKSRQAAGLVFGAGEETLPGGLIDAFRHRGFVVFRIQGPSWRQSASSPARRGRILGFAIQDPLEQGVDVLSVGGSAHSL